MKKLQYTPNNEYTQLSANKNAGSIIAYGGIGAPPYQSGQFEATNRHISNLRKM